MIRKDLYRIKNGIDASAGLTNEASLTFAHTLAIIYDEVMREIKLVEKAKKKPSDKFIEYEEKYNRIQLEYAIKKEDGTLLMNKDSVMIKNPDKYDAKITALRIEYKDVIDAQEALTKEFEDFLNEEINTSFTKISINLFPPNVSVGIIVMLNPVITK